MKSSILKEKSFSFALRIVKLSQFLQKDCKEFVLSKQLLRSGTSVGANTREAFNGESTKDFIHKLSIAQKETDETLYWIELLFAAHYINQIQFDSINADAIEMIKLLKSSILKSKTKAIHNT